MVDTTETRDVCCRWWAAWTSKADSDQKRPLLAEGLTFPLNTEFELNDRESFLAGESWPDGFTATMLGESYGGSTAVHVYEAQHGPARLRVSELFEVRDGQIASIDFITDTGAYVAFIAGEHPDTPSDQDTTAATQDVCSRYFAAWTTRDVATTESLLAPEFTFVAGDMTVEGRAAFLDANAFPADATTTLVSEAYQGDIGFQMYDARRGQTTARIVEQLTVRDDVIISSTFQTDMAAFMTLVTP